MAELSIDGERFADMYDKVRPTLIRLSEKGLQRTINIEMEPFFPRQVIEKLDSVLSLIKRGRDVLENAPCSVVLAYDELQMLEWGLKKARTNA